MPRPRNSTGCLERSKRRCGSSISGNVRRSDRTPRWDERAPTMHGMPPAAPGPRRSRFWESNEPERFGLAGPGGDQLDFMRRTPQGVEVFAAICAASVWRSCPPSSGRHANWWARSSARPAPRLHADAAASRGDRLAGFAGAAAVHRTPHQPADSELTAGLTDFAAGDWRASTASNRRATRRSRAVPSTRSIAWPISCDDSRERLVHLTQMASWQSLARKTAHELKNSLTPIRLTVEEMLARQPHGRPRVHASRPSRSSSAKSKRSSGACARSPSSRASRR